MTYSILATDYDGTIAENGQVPQATLEALKKWQSLGKKLFLITGRRVDDLLTVFPEIELFDLVIDENGALLYYPKDKTEKLLASPPSENFINRLTESIPQPCLFIGKIIVATWKPYDLIVEEIIKELNLDLRIILNKKAVMVLPGGVNKALGLKAAKEELGLSQEKVVGVGDAENDLDFFYVCEYSVAVANALAEVKEKVNFVTEKNHGEGVIELIEKLLKE